MKLWRRDAFNAIYLQLVKSALHKWKHQARTHSNVEVFHHNIFRRKLSAAFRELKTHAVRQKLCKAMQEKANRKLAQTMISTWVGRISRSRMQGRILVRKLEDIVVTRRISPCFE